MRSLRRYADGRNNWVFRQWASAIPIFQQQNQDAGWLAQGLHGELDYMAKHGLKRSRPAQLIPGTLRVISLRMNYLPPAARDSWQVLEETEPPTYPAMRWDVTIHKVMRQRLAELAEKIRSEVAGFNGRVFTDSAPVMEVELARKAGIGWRGKHTLLLSREHGSWFFLGEIM